MKCSVKKKGIETLKKASITREDDEVTKLQQTALDEGEVRFFQINLFPRFNIIQELFKMAEFPKGVG